MIDPAEGVCLLSDEELARFLEDLIAGDGRVDREELTISCSGGHVTLEGALPSDEEHEIVLALLWDAAGIDRIVDRVEVERIAWERPERAPGLEPSPDADEDELPEALAEEPASTSEPLEALIEGTPYTPPDRPVPLPPAHRAGGGRVR